MKKNNKKGFTLAELLIVVAIIAVLVAIAIPIFRGQLEKAREATDEANARSAYGEAVAAYLADAASSSGTITLGSQTFTYTASGEEVTVKGTGCQSSKYKTSITYNGKSFS